MTPTRDALRLIIDKLPTKSYETEELPLSTALHRVLCDNIFSPSDVPPYDRAAMDGYAVIAEDTYSASTNSPISLKTLHGSNNAEAFTLRRGEAAAVITGGPMPKGADAVAMVEYTKAYGDAVVEISTEVHPAENVSRVGEDMRKGTLVLRKGQHLLPQDLGILTSLGIATVKVFRKLKVAVLSTGNELLDQRSGSAAKVPDVNRPMLLNAVAEHGCEPVDMGISADDFESISTKLKQAISSSDLILVTAGTSVGPRDYVPRVINELGKPGLLVHGVAMRPSMPTGLGIVDGKPVIALPGYPVSAYLAFLEFVPPLIAYLTRASPLPQPKVEAKLSRRIAGVLGSRTYVRVSVVNREGKIYADPVSASGAGILSSIVRTNGIIIIPESVEGYEEGETVDVELFRPVDDENSRA